MLLAFCFVDARQGQSVNTFIEPPPLIRKRVVILAGLLSLMTLFEIFICCFYSYISGHAS